MDSDTITDLAFEDLSVLGERLYVAALRYVRAFERDDLDQEHHHGEDGPCKVHTGQAAATLRDITAKYGEAYDRAEAAGVWAGLDDEDGLEAEVEAKLRCYDSTPWSEMFPDGRCIFYEGDEPQKFAEEIKAEFGFDPSEDKSWGEVIADDEAGDAFTSYRFHCPPEHLDAIYGNGRWPLGS
jgi:hypothetical protein